MPPPRHTASGDGGGYTDNSVVNTSFHADFGSNTASDYEMERKVKRWVTEAINNLLESEARRNPVRWQV